MAPPAAASGVTIAPHLLTMGYLRKPEVGIAKHVLSGGYMNLLACDIRIPPHIIWGRYLKVDLLKA